MLAPLHDIARQAGREILHFYSESTAADFKTDGSPITNADRAAHRFIVEALGKLTPDIPVLSEESAEQVQSECLGWNRFWLVDPLDGTKEFVKKTHEFTVNICLVEDRQPVLGVVHAPALNISYFAQRGAGAWKQTPDAPPNRIRTRPADRQRLCVVASKDHVGPGEAALLKRLPNAQLKSMGSSLKFCLVAEGQADLYPRFGPTMEWDTAAAQCVVEQAGGIVMDTTGQLLTYQKPALKNPGLLTLGDPSVLSWQELLLPEQR
jgi:3'(2'), 5'-bisphosphate nucleotidase